MKVILLFLFLLLSTLLHGQDLFYTKAASQLFTKEELRTLIRESALKTVSEHKIDRDVFELNYPPLEDQLLVTSRPVIVKKFWWIESTGSSSDREREIELYKKELYRAVRDVIVSNSAFEKLVAADQTDRILKFFSDIKVKKSGLLEVTEYITIYNGDGSQGDLYYDIHPDASREINNEIQHGLVRDFPTVYENNQGFRVVLPFTIKSIYRNSKDEPYVTKDLDNGVRVFLGSASENLAVGIHEYVISYETSNQLIFHSNKDELFWNVNGTGWVFTADSVGAKITFPTSAKIFESAFYTGLQGATEKNCVSKLLNDTTIHFSGTKTFTANENLSVAAAIQKGVLAAPSSIDSYISFIKSNWPIPAIVGVLLFMLAINLLNWFRFGRDPEKGTIIPQFEPPNDIWPSDAGYIYHQKYKPQQFSAALIDLATKKGINIEVKREGLILKHTVYTFRKGSNTHFTLEEFANKAYDWRLTDLYNLEISRTYNPFVGSLASKLEKLLESKFLTDSKLNKDKKGFFSWNAGAASWGFFFWFLIGFVSIFVVGKLAYASMIAIIVVALIAIGFAMQFVFHKIMPAYNKEGRKVLDHLLGFRMYLSTAEERRFDKLSPPQKDLKLFERLLPYAIALNCENEWASKFENVLADAAENAGYTPTYLSGDMNRNLSISTFSSGISSGLSSSVASASTAPSSSSGGSSGGGSSGGGGGGGGGGGW
jgi:uncharacterized membrane protein YgcG